MNEWNFLVNENVTKAGVVASLPFHYITDCALPEFEMNLNILDVITVGAEVLEDDYGVYSSKLNEYHL